MHLYDEKSENKTRIKNFEFQCFAFRNLLKNLSKDLDSLYMFRTPYIFSLSTHPF